MKKVFTLLTLLSLALGVSAATSVPTKDTQIAVKTFVETTLLWTSSTNFATWYAEGWATSGKSSDWSDINSTTNKKYTINPENDVACDATLVSGIGVKNNQDSKQLFMYVTNVTKIEAYFINSSGTDTRTAYVNVTGSGAAEQASQEVEGNVTGKVTKDGLTASQKYLVQFNASADMVLYAVRFTAASASANVSLTIPASGVASFSSASALNLSSVDAYVVSSLSASSATLTKVTEAPANTGLLILGSTGACDLPVKASATAVGTNYLKATVKPKAVAADAAYVLSSGEFHPANAGTIPAGKAYLDASDVPALARGLNLSLDFGSDVTGIAETKLQSTADQQAYDLQGRKVASPAKGIYIVNGKKVVIK